MTTIRAIPTKILERGCVEDQPQLVGLASVLRLAPLDPTHSRAPAVAALAALGSSASIRG